MTSLERLAARAAAAVRLDDVEARELAHLSLTDPAPVIAAATGLRDATTGPRISFSKKVFIPLTKLCRDSCGYCTFVHPPVPGQRAYLTIEEVLEIARAGEAAGCKEALFTLGEKPEYKELAERDQFAPELVYFSECVPAKSGALFTKSSDPFHDQLERPSGRSSSYITFHGVWLFEAA